MRQRQKEVYFPEPMFEEKSNLSIKQIIAYAKSKVTRSISLLTFLKVGSIRSISDT